MSVGLSGNLVDFGIADVFQLIGQQRKTGVLELKSETTRAQLVFDEGMVVSAAPASGRAGELDPLADRLIRCGLLTRDRAEEAVQACRASAQTLASTLREREWLPDDQIESAEELVTRDTIFEVLRWRTGTFDFRAQEVSHTRDRSQLLGAEQILMDGLRMVDEWQSFADLVPSEETVFQRSGRFERYLEKLGRDDAEARARAERVFQRVDGRLSARRVIDLAQLGTFDGMRGLAELREADAIRPLHPESVRHVRRVARSTTPTGRPSAARRAIAAAIPLAILAGVVWWTAAESMAAPEPTPGGPVARATLAELEDAYATRAARHAIEAYRFHHGDWPESLADVEAAGLLDRDALAAPRGRPYYSQQQAEGWVFLGPDR
ncbi:MAG: DUF4388 domain-containing protein [Myxococcota bacterium]